MTKYQRAIKKVLKRTLQGGEPVVGICVLLSWGISSEVKTTHRSKQSLDMWLHRQFKTWAYTSGDMLYPVPATIRGLSAREQYQQGSERWVGEQLKLRQDLIKHLLSNITDYKVHTEAEIAAWGMEI